MTERLDLKWGSIKGWSNLSEASQAIMKRYMELGANMSVMLHRDSPEQKAIICELIDSVSEGGGELYNSWAGKTMTAEAAKIYVRGYSQ